MTLASSHFSWGTLGRKCVFARLSVTLLHSSLGFHIPSWNLTEYIQLSGVHSSFMAQGPSNLHHSAPPDLPPWFAAAEELPATWSNRQRPKWRSCRQWHPWRRLVDAKCSSTRSRSESATKRAESATMSRQTKKGWVGNQNQSESATKSAESATMSRQLRKRWAGN